MPSEQAPNLSVPGGKKTLFSLNPNLRFKSSRLQKPRTQTNSMIPQKKILLSLIAAICCGSASAQETVLVSANSSAWKYNFNNTNLGTTWRTVAYNDSTWLTGTAPIGYGDSPLGTTISPTPNPKPTAAYFRHTFTLTSLQASTLNSLGAEMRRDDGAVIYLNNVELFRTNMPGGAISFSTLASSAIGGGQESAYNNFDGLTSNLVAGVNVLAVELHQSATTSSDAHMDIKLLGYNVAPSFGVVGANRSIKFEEATYYSGDGVVDFIRAPGEGFVDYEWSSNELSGSGIFGAFQFAPASGDELASSEWSAWFVNCETKSENIDLRNFTNVKAFFQARSFTDPGVTFSASDALRLGVTTSNDGAAFSTKLYAANLTGASGEESNSSDGQYRIQLEHPWL
jgi:hypothetical protein